MANIGEEHLGKDVSLDLETSDLIISSNNDFQIKKFDKNLEQAIIHRLKTRVGELPLHPLLYGSLLPDLIGTNATDETLDIARMHIRKSLLQEPRIEEDGINRIDTSFTNSDKQEIRIDIEVKPIKELNTLNIVFPFIIQ